MYTKMIVPATRSVTIDLPENYIGEQVRLIAVVEKAIPYKESLEEERINQVKETYSKYKKTDLSNFKFNRDEANDFD